MCILMEGSIKPKTQTFSASFIKHIGEWIQYNKVHPDHEAPAYRSRLLEFQIFHRFRINFLVIKVESSTIEIM